MILKVSILFYIFFFLFYLTDINNRPNKVYWFSPFLSRPVHLFYISVYVLRLSTNASRRYFTHARFTYARARVQRNR